PRGAYRAAAVRSIKSPGARLPALVARRVQHACRARDRATTRRPPAGAARPCRTSSDTTASEGSPTLTPVKVTEAAPAGGPVADRARLGGEVSGRRREGLCGRAGRADGPGFTPR